MYLLREEVGIVVLRLLTWVAVWNRTDCCAERLSDYYVLVSDHPLTNDSLAATLAEPGVTAFHEQGIAGRPTSFPMSHSVMSRACAGAASAAASPAAATAAIRLISHEMLIARPSLAIPTVPPEHTSEVWRGSYSCDGVRSRQYGGRPLK
jgi:hypothetical protein